MIALARVGDRVDDWERRFKRAYARMQALETAVCRRLLAHNADEPCGCEHCRWLRSLFDERLERVLAAERDRGVTIVSNDFEAAARRQLEQLEHDEQAAEAAIAAATAARDGAKRERTALEAALATYRRKLGDQPVVRRPAGPKALRAPRPEPTDDPDDPPAPTVGTGIGAAIRERLPVWAVEHDGLVAIADVARALVEEGVAADLIQAQNNLSYALRQQDDVYTRVARGVYRMIAPADQGAA